MDHSYLGGSLQQCFPKDGAYIGVCSIYITLLSVCDRQPEREAECLEKLDAHVRLFFRTFNIKRGEP